MAARWRITSDTPRDELSRDGTFTSVREIRFEVMDLGRDGVVVVPTRLYTPEYVQSVIQAEADTILAVGNLGHG